MKLRSVFAGCAIFIASTFGQRPQRTQIKYFRLGASKNADGTLSAGGLKEPLSELLFDFSNLYSFDNITDFQVIKILDGHTAFHIFLHLFGIIFKAFEGS